MQSIKKLIFLNIFLFVFITNILSQVIGGKIVQINNGEPVPFTTLAVEGTTLGMVTDFDGNFVFEIPQEHKTGTLVISCVGFKERKMNLSKMIGKLNLVIELESTSVEIDEVVVEKKSLLPYSILKKAGNAVKDNYINKPFNYEVYYKNEKRLVSGKKLDRESVLLLYDKQGYKRSNAYKTFKELNYKFTQTKRNFEVNDLYSGNTDIDNLLEMDITRHMNNVLDKRRVYDFDVMIKDELMYKNDSAWVLIYKCNKPDLLRAGDIHATSYSGEIIISKKDYAVLYNKTDIKSSNFSNISRNIAAGNDKINTKVTGAIYSYEVVYKWDDYYYALDQITFKLDLNYSDSKKDQIKRSESLFQVTKININNPVEVDTRQYFDDTEYDPIFWSEFIQ